MSTSYGAPIGLFSIDPLNGTETMLADTSVTNLLAELPVLETQANGANLGPQLAGGTQVEFASTARTATLLYSLAVQQVQATSFVTDNYNSVCSVSPLPSLGCQRVSRQTHPHARRHAPWPTAV